VTERTASYIFAGVMAIPLVIVLARLWWAWMQNAIDLWRDKP